MHTNAITLPRVLQKAPRRYITQSGGRWSPETVALAMQLSLDNHGTADAIRRLAHNLVDKVPLESQPKMKLLAREKDGALVLDAANRIVERVLFLMLA